MKAKQEVIAFIDYVSHLLNTAASEARTTKEIEEVARLTVGKNGIFTLMQKEISEIYKNEKTNTRRNSKANY